MSTTYKANILAIGLFLAVTVSVSAAPGDLDPTFGIGGRIYPPSGSQTPYSEGNDLVVQPDQKILVSAGHFNFSSGEFGLLLSRYLPNGTLDPTFGVGGQVFNGDIGGGGKLALQPDGRILVAAGGHILRYKTDGNLDTHFDEDGVLLFSAFSAYKLAVQNDGRIIVAGTKNIGPNHGDPALFGLARLNSDGSFDSSFGTNGILTTAFPYPTSYLGDAVIQADGKIVAAGSTHTINGNGLCSPCNIALSRYNADGSLDTSFGTAGRVVMPGEPYNWLHGSDITLQADNKIVVAGHFSGAYDVGGLVIRFMPDGLLDAAFGTAGQVLIPNLCPFSMAVQSNGKIVVAGGTTDYDPSNSSHELGRLLSNGELDPTFGANGRVSTFFPNLPQGFYINGRIWGMAVQRDGKIATVGSWSGTDWDGNWHWSYTAIARYLGDFVVAQPARVQFDFDGDRRADISVFRPSDSVWYLNRPTSGFSATQFGLSNDKLTPADFDGDGRTDIAVFRAGTWYWLNSSTGSFNSIQFGLSDDIPLPADFTGDGRAELAVYRGGTWFTLNLATNQFQAVQFGLSTDKPLPADYDGDSRADYAVYRDGTWYLLQSTQGFAAIRFGLSIDQLVPADYDGDGKTDLAVYRDGVWYLRQSSQGFTAFQFGLSTDIPAPADYDGDGRADAAVYRNGVWYLRQTTGGISIRQFGLANDKPVPAVYLP